VYSQARVIGLTSVDADAEPSRLAEVAMLGYTIFCGQDAGLHIAARKVGDRVATRLMKEYNVLAVNDVLITELDAHPTPERFGVQNPLRHRLRCEEVPDRRRGQWALLPCQSHRFCPSSAARRPEWAL
jgi:hypothetical protein